MKNYRKGWGHLVGLAVLMVYSSSALAQYEYRVGKGRASIEPDQHVLSVALAGYGAPREGRFSLEWAASVSLGEATDAAIVSNNLYLLRDGAVWQVALNDLGGAAVAVEQPESIRMLAGNERQLYALNADNELLEAVVSRRGGLRWRKKNLLQQTPTSLSYWKGQFIMLDTAGVLWAADDRRGHLVWDMLDTCEGAMDIMADGDDLYALTAQQEILRRERPGDWLRVAIANGMTYGQDIRLLLASGQGFWAMDGAGVLYQARHSSTGQLNVGALVIQQGKDRIAILGADVCGFDADFIHGVKQDIQQQFGIQPTAIMVNASHTHFAPVTQQWRTWGHHCQQPDSVYLNAVVRVGMMDAVRQAVKSLQPANLYVGKSEVEIGHNRSLPGTDLPYDKGLDVIRVDYEHTEEDDLVFSAGCHPVFQNAGLEGVTISPNYPGVAREMLQQRPDIQSAMFIQGCGGDINPIDADHRLTARKLASAVTNVLDRVAMQQIEGGIAFYLDTVEFGTQPWPEAKLREFRAANEGQEGNVGAEKNVRWADLMLQHHANGTMPATMPVFVQTFNIGSWKLVGISRETTTEYSLGIKALWPDKLVTVAGYCNDVSSYLPTSKHMNAGTYEGSDSFFWYGQPNTFPKNVYEKIMEAIASKNR